MNPWGITKIHQTSLQYSANLGKILVSQWETMSGPYLTIPLSDFLGKLKNLLGKSSTKGCRSSWSSPGRA